MELDSIAIANYFIDKSKLEPCQGGLTLLRLVRYVYLAYGFGLAILGRSILDERYDSVEAWDFGPVIPRVLDSFKHVGKDIIQEKAQVVCSVSASAEMSFATPVVHEKDVMRLLDCIWKRYASLSAAELRNSLRHEGTTWAFCYRPGENREIPEGITRLFYTDLWKALTSEGEAGV